MTEPAVQGSTPSADPLLASLDAPATSADANAVTEQPAVTKDLAPKREDPRRKINSQFAALSRKEKALRDREKAVADWEQVQALRTTDPLAFLEKSGLTVDQIVDHVVKGSQATAAETPEQLAERIASEKIAAWEKSQQERQSAEKRAQDEALVRDYRDGLAKQIYADPEFELITAHEAAEEVFQLIEHAFAEDPTGKVLMDKDGKIDVRKAASAVEQYYFERDSELLSKAQKLRAAMQGSARTSEAGEGVDGRPASRDPLVESLGVERGASALQASQRPAHAEQKQEADDQPTTHEWSKPVVVDRWSSREVRRNVPSLNSTTTSGHAAGSGQAKTPTDADINARLLRSLSAPLR